MSWQLRAVCAGENPEIWFPPSYTSPSGMEDVALARAICAECPVAADCLADALTHERAGSIHYRAGIWGGLTPGERHTLSLTSRECVECGATFQSKWTKQITCSVDCRRARHHRQKVDNNRARQAKAVSA